MDIPWIRDNLETEEIFTAKPVQFTVEAEAVLPGGLREEAQVYYADAEAVALGGELTGNRITADGKVNFHVLYAQGDMKKVQALEASADFSQTLPLQRENAQQLSGRVGAHAQVMKATGRVFGGRLMLQAVVALSAEAEAPRSVSFIRDAENTEGLEKTMQALRYQRAVGEGENRSLVKEEIELTDVLQVRDTLFATAHAQVEDILGGADGKAVVTGSIQVEACHTSDMPGRPLIYTRHTLPYEQAVQLTGAPGESLAARSDVCDTAVLTQEGPDGSRTMRTEIQLRTRVTAVADRQMDVLRDAFTLSGEGVECKEKQVVFRTGTVNEAAAESGRAVMTLPESSPRVRTPLLAFVRPIPVKTEKKGEKLVAEGVLETTLIYLTDDSDIPVSAQQEQPFRAVFTTKAEPEDSLSFMVLQAEPSAVTGDRVEIKYILQMQAEGVRKEGRGIITDAVPVTAASAEKGIALYFLQPGEELWDVARHYRLPIRTLKELNPDLTDTPMPGEKIIAYRR